MLQAWKAEYARRFALHVAKGGGVKTFLAVPLQPAAERVVMSLKTAREAGIAMDRPVTCSSATPDHPANLANNGIIAPDNYWESTDKNAWWQVDLGKIAEITTVRVIPYYRDPHRHYAFVVKTSVDGRKWDMFLDKSDNTRHLGIEGASYTGQLTPARYVRVEMLKFRQRRQAPRSSHRKVTRQPEAADARLDRALTMLTVVHLSRPATETVR